MYKLSLILLAFFSLVLPILAAPVPSSDEVNAALSGSGRVRVIHRFLHMILIFWLVGNLVL